MKKIIIIVWIILFPILSFSQDADDVYDYPIKPGTEEWKQLKNIPEAEEACQIPNNILSSISTKGLLITCMNYPLKISILASNNYKNGFESIMKTFNGAQELINRADIVPVLLDFYSEIDPKYYKIDRSISKQGENAFDYTFIDMLITQDNILNKLTEENKISLLKDCIQYDYSKREKSEVYGNISRVSAGYLIMKILIEFNPNLLSQYKDKRIDVFYSNAELIDISLINDLIREAEIILKEKGVNNDE